MNACPVRITIVGADAFTFCNGSTLVPDWAAASSDWTAPVATTSSVRLVPPTTPNAAGGAARALAAGAPTFVRAEVALPGTALSARFELSLSHAVRMQATKTAMVTAFIGDSVEVSGETPPKSLLTHHCRLEAPAAISRPLSAGRDQPAAGIVPLTLPAAEISSISFPADCTDRSSTYV